MPVVTTEEVSRVDPAMGSGRTRRTRPRVQVILLCLCAAASGAIVAVAHLPWFGSIGDPSVPEFSAVSPNLWRTGLLPGAQAWGYLLIAWAGLVVVMALSAALACALLRRSGRPPLGGILLCVGVASLALAGLAGAELTTSAQFDLDSYAGSDWGAWIGLILAIVSCTGAWLAWATWRFPHLWGVETCAEQPSPIAAAGVRRAKP